MTGKVASHLIIANPVILHAFPSTPLKKVLASPGNLAVLRVYTHLCNNKALTLISPWGPRIVMRMDENQCPLKNEIAAGTLPQCDALQKISSMGGL